VILVATLLEGSMCGQRIFAVHASYNINSVLHLMRDLYPDTVIEGDVSDHGMDGTLFKERGRGEELLRRLAQRDFTNLQTSVQRTCDMSLQR
jgi:hypothetical protein